MTQVNIKRVYDEPSEQDGYRVLVDRLWPRGMKREYLKYDYWAKEVTPSNDLRKWFHADIEKRWGTFADMYLNPEKRNVPLYKNDAFQKVQKRRVPEKR